MSLVIITIPDHPKDWPDWLEQQLVGMRLGDLVAELQVSAASEERTKLTDILSPEQLAEVKDSGLSLLKPTDFQTLFSSPNSLLDLQEEILVNGGEYWQSVPRTKQHQQAAAVATARVQEDLALFEKQPRPIPKEKSSKKPSWLWLGALAATVLVGFMIWRGGTLGPTPAKPGAIIGDPTLLAQNSPTPEQFFQALAESSLAWFDQHPRDSDELDKLMRRLSDNFQQLIDDNPLTDKERKWFKTKCLAWKQKVDDLVVELGTNRQEFGSSRDAVDDIIMKMIEVLKTGPTEEELQAIS